MELIHRISSDSSSNDGKSDYNYGDDNDDSCPGLQELRHYNSISKNNTIGLMPGLQEHTQYDSNSDDDSIPGLQDHVIHNKPSDEDSDGNIALTSVISNNDSLINDDFFDAQ